MDLMVSTFGNVVHARLVADASNTSSTNLGNPFPLHIYFQKKCNQACGILPMVCALAVPVRKMGQVHYGICGPPTVPVVEPHLAVDQSVVVGGQTQRDELVQLLAQLLAGSAALPALRAAPARTRWLQFL